MKSVENLNFNELIVDNLVKPYVEKLNLDEELSNNVTLSFIKNLNVFNNSQINRLTDSDKNKIVKTFNECYEKKNFNDFATLINNFMPKVSGADFDTLPDVLIDIMDKDKSEKKRQKLAEIYSENDINYSSFITLLDKRDIYERIKDTLLNNKYLAMVNSPKGDGISGSQFAQILTGAYYYKNFYEQNRQSFNKYRELQSLLLSKSGKKAVSKLDLAELGIDASYISKLSKNTQSTSQNDEQYDKIVDDFTNDYVKNVKTSLFSKETQYEKYLFRDIEKISKQQRVLTSVLSLNYVKDYLNLNSEHKKINELNPSQVNLLTKLISTDQNEKLDERLNKLQNFSEIIDSSVEKFYDECKDFVVSDENVEASDENAKKDKIKLAFVEELTKNGAFASRDESEFAGIATFVSTKVGQELIDKEHAYDSQVIKNEGENDKTIASIHFNNKWYYLDNITVPQNHSEDEISCDKLIKDEMQVKPNLLDNIKTKLNKEYGENFNALTADDIQFGASKLTQAMLATISEKNIDLNKTSEQAEVNDAENSQEGAQSEFAPNPENFNQEDVIFTSNYLYRTAFNQAYSAYAKYIIMAKMFTEQFGQQNFDNSASEETLNTSNEFTVEPLEVLPIEEEEKVESSPEKEPTLDNSNPKEEKVEPTKKDEMNEDLNEELEHDDEQESDEDSQEDDNQKSFYNLDDAPLSLKAKRDARRNRVLSEFGSQSAKKDSSINDMISRIRETRKKEKELKEQAKKEQNNIATTDIIQTSEEEAKIKSNEDKTAEFDFDNKELEKVVKEYCDETCEFLRKNIKDEKIKKLYIASVVDVQGRYKNWGNFEEELKSVIDNLQNIKEKAIESDKKEANAEVSKEQRIINFFKRLEQSPSKEADTTKDAQQDKDLEKKQDDKKFEVAEDLEKKTEKNSSEIESVEKTVEQINQQEVVQESIIQEKSEKESVVREKIEQERIEKEKVVQEKIEQIKKETIFEVRKLAMGRQIGFISKFEDVSTVEEAQKIKEEILEDARRFQQEKEAEEKRQKEIRAKEKEKLPKDAKLEPFVRTKTDIKYFDSSSKKFYIEKRDAYVYVGDRENGRLLKEKANKEAQKERAQ